MGLADGVAWQADTIGPKRRIESSNCLADLLVTNDGIVGFPDLLQLVRGGLL